MEVVRDLVAVGESGLGEFLVAVYACFEKVSWFTTLMFGRALKDAELGIIPVPVRKIQY